MLKEIISENPRIEIWQGDCLELMKNIPENSIDCVITSPPYYSLRDYQIEGQIGLEPTFIDYQNKLLEVFNEIKKILKKSGSFWLNMGDVYGGSNCGYGQTKESTGFQNIMRQTYYPTSKQKPLLSKINPKCMMMMPERIVLKMIDEQGWILRQKIIWAKQLFINKEKRTIGFTKPSSVKDRFNITWEYLFHFVKNKKYYFDLDSIKIPSKNITIKRLIKFIENNEFERLGNPQFHKIGKNNEEASKILSNYVKNFINNKNIYKNLPTCWQINLELHNFKNKFGIEHFAIFPKELCIIPIIATCPPNGIVLDPFAGSGTVGIVAKELKRNSILIELNPNYCKLAKIRIEKGDKPIKKRIKFVSVQRKLNHFI